MVLPLSFSPQGIYEISGMIYARPCPKIDEISEAVRGAYGIPKEELCVKGHKGNESRDAAIYLSKKYSRCMCDEIGKYFGGIRPSAFSSEFGEQASNRANEVR